MLDIAELVDIEDEDDQEQAQWTPDEWVILITGFRGSGKTVLDAFFGKWALESGFPLLSNIEYVPEGLQKHGIPGMPIPLDFDKLITFQLDVPGAMIQIDEVDTFLDKLRTIANQNLLTTKFLEQLRKRTLKIVMSCQFGSYLPYGTLDQVDLMIYAQDAFFTEWGRDKGLSKGTTFIYTVSDKSGLFTGGRKIPWRFMLPNCQALWDIYDTSKLHDPTQFAKKYEIKRDKYVMGEDGAYPESEENAQGQERELRQYRSTLSLVWGSQAMGFIIDNNESIDVEDGGNKVRISMANVERAMASMKGRSRKGIEASYNELLKLADKGTVIRRTSNNMLEIIKPEAMAGGDDVVTYEDDLGFEKI